MQYVHSLQRYPKEIAVVATNASSDAAMRAYLLKYDTLHGRLEGDVHVEGEHLHINGSPVRVVREKDPEKCPWRELKVDLVVEATGVFRSRDKCEPHLHAGARAVIITAPPKDDVTMIVLGVNDHLLKGALPIVSAASCTTNCIAPVVKVLDDFKGVARGLICTTHAYTTSQNLLDNSTSSAKLRIARAAALNIIPSTTGAAKAVSKIFPHLQGKIDGMALRIPMADVSATYLVLELKEKVSGEIDLSDTEAFAGEHDAFEALVSLGYTMTEARDALRKIRGKNMKTGAVVKEALKLLSR